MAEPIRNYWYTALQNCLVVQQEIKEKDHPILQNLTKIELILIEHSDNFSLQFHFQSNEFFTNSVLKKTFILRGRRSSFLILQTARTLSKATPR